MEILSSIFTMTKKEGRRWDGQTTTQKQDLALERTAQPFKASMGHLKLGENLYLRKGCMIQDY